MSAIVATIKGNVVYAESPESSESVQTMPLPRAAMNIDPAPGRGGGDVLIVDESALVPEEGPAGTIADIEKPKNGIVSRYVVREGDTLSGIATLFGVTPETILWANDLPRGAALRPGQALTILPVPGLRYTVKNGDTLEAIAKKFKADPVEIGSYNGVDDATLAVGIDIIIPDGEITPPPAPKRTPKAPGTRSKQATRPGAAAAGGFYMAPLVSYIETQGIHGYNGVDMAAPPGTPVLASASGEVIVAKDAGYNGGYGNYIVIQHENGSQTLYAHLSRVSVYDGEQVVRGQVIGYVGSTGKSTGPHLHFEIRGGIRNPF